jgi:hypothetical protein
VTTTEVDDDHLADDVPNSWNFRVLHTRLCGEDIYSIIEAYYRDDRIVAWAPASAPTGETLEELCSGDLRLMTEAADKPVLTADELPGVNVAPHPTASQN